MQYKVFTGPFNNPNYAGTWLTSIFPFSFFLFSYKRPILKFKKIFFCITALAIVLAVFLTHSRNAITNLSIAFTFLIGLSIKKIFLIYLIFLGFLSFIFIFEIPIGTLNFLSEK